MDEIELKLQMSTASADLLEASGLLPDRPEPVRQRAVYFDTPDQALAAAGISLAFGRRRESASRR